MEVIHFVDLDLAYEELGSGTPLVLIHGFPLDGSVWQEVAYTLEGQFHVLVPDLRGFGNSITHSTTAPAIDTYAHDIAHLLDYFGHEQALLAGHSMGGYVALAFARLYPQRVWGLGLVSTQALADTPERQQGRHATAAQVDEKGVGVVADAMAPKFTPDVRLQAEARKVIERQNPQGVSDALKAMAGRSDSSALLAGFSFPTAILHGDADALIPVERAREMQASIPQARLFELPGVGHLPMLEAPQATAQALRSLG